MNLAATRRRLALGYVAVVALVVLVFGAVTVVGFSASTDRDRDLVLVTKARAMAAGGAAGMTGRQDTAEFGFVLFDDRGRARDRDATAPSLGLPVAGGARQAARDGVPFLETVEGPRGRVRVASVPVAGDVVSQVGRPLGPDAATLDRLLGVLAWAGALALVLAGLGGLALSRRALRPVRAAFDRQRAFVADASHELRTPLALVRLDAEVLARDPGAPDAQELLAHQVDEIDRLGDLVGDLLTLARLDADDIAVADEPFDVAGLLAAGARRFAPRAAAARIALDVRADEPLLVRGDAGRAEQVLGVLLDNALRYAPGGGRVLATARRNVDRVEVDVSDDGPGIPADELERVFDRFHRARTDAARGSGGAGLGLAIARELARVQHGDLVAVPAPDGAGACLRLSLPASARRLGAAPGLH